MKFINKSEAKNTFFQNVSRFLGQSCVERRSGRFPRLPRLILNGFLHFRLGNHLESVVEAAVAATGPQHRRSPAVGRLFVVTFLTTNFC